MNEWNELYINFNLKCKLGNKMKMIKNLKKIRFLKYLSNKIYISCLIDVMKNVHFPVYNTIY